jgi:branched-chain amino acid aminotransferase group I
VSWVYLNGGLVEAERAVLPALDRGLLYGYGLFETMRSYGGRVFRLAEHYRRLEAGADLLAMPVPLTLGALEEATDATLARNGLPDARLRLTVTAGPEIGGGSSVVLFTREVTEYPPELRRRGMAAVVSGVRRNETSPLARVKSLNCLDNLLAREEARRSGAGEALLLNTRGFIAEGATSNVFLVRDGALLTPAVEAGALPGITRQTVLELAGEGGVAVEEADVSPGDLTTADEAFLTNSVMEVMPLVSVGGRPVGRGRPGPLTERLAALYRDLVARETSRASAV